MANEDKSSLESVWDTGSTIGSSVASAGAGSFFKILATGANLLFQWAGLDAAEKQAQRAQDVVMAKERSAETLAREQIAQTAKATRERLHFDKREARRAWKWKEDEKNYIQGQNTVNRFLGLLDKDPASKDRLMMTWNSARV
jgi:hypothetical protein